MEEGQSKTRENPSLNTDQVGQEELCAVLRLCFYTIFLVITYFLLI